MSARTDDEIDAGVESLLSKSLLNRPVSVGQARYAMLEMIREFALEQLASAGEQSEVAGRHVSFYLQMAAAVEPELSGEDPASAVERLASEVDNLRAALRHAATAGRADTGLELAGAIWRFWQFTGQLQEGRYWLERMLGIEDASNAARAKGLDARAGLAYWLGDFESANQDYSDARDLYRTTGDRLGEANALYCLSLVASFRDNAEAGERLASEARVAYEALGAEAQVGQALIAEATAAWKNGDLPRARHLHEMGLEIHSKRKDRAMVASQLVGIGGIAFQQGHATEAVGDASEALDIAIETGNTHTQLFALDSLASFAASDCPVEAVRLAGAACSLREAHGGGWTLESFGVENARTATAGVLTRTRSSKPGRRVVE